MSLMSMQLWALADVAGPIFAILGAQFIIAVIVNIVVVFRVMGSNYDAAVVCSGFGGISLGSTPTAMANMSAVAQRYGASHLAFIIVPLVCAFFIDLVNARDDPLLPEPLLVRSSGDMNGPVAGTGPNMFLVAKPFLSFPRRSARRSTRSGSRYRRRRRPR